MLRVVAVLATGVGVKAATEPRREAMRGSFMVVVVLAWGEEANMM